MEEFFKRKIKPKPIQMKHCFFQFQGKIVSFTWVSFKNLTYWFQTEIASHNPQKLYEWERRVKGLILHFYEMDFQWKNKGRQYSHSGTGYHPAEFCPNIIHSHLPDLGMFPLHSVTLFIWPHWPFYLTSFYSWNIHWKSVAWKIQSVKDKCLLIFFGYRTMKVLG